MYIDLVDGQMYALLKNNVLIDVNKNKLLTLTGWAIDDADKNAGKEVYLVLKHKDEETIIPTRREYRPDVAKHFGVDNYSQSGWAFTFKTDNFMPGCYSLSVLILRTGRQEYYELGGSKPICFSKGGTHLR